MFVARDRKIVILAPEERHVGSRRPDIAVELRKERHLTFIKISVCVAPPELDLCQSRSATNIPLLTELTLGLLGLSQAKTKTSDLPPNRSSLPNPVLAV